MIKTCDVCGQEFDTAFWRETPDDPNPRQLPRHRNHSVKKRCSMACDSEAVKRQVAERKSRPASEGAAAADAKTVAKVYATVLRNGGNPTLAVAEHLHVTRSLAAKRVQDARRRGLLPPTVRGSKGAPVDGHRRVVALANRRRFELCEACVVAWPCPTVRRHDLGERCIHPLGAIPST